jgi:hypothetical protein
VFDEDDNDDIGSGFEDEDDDNDDSRNSFSNDDIEFITSNPPTCYLGNDESDSDLIMITEDEEMYPNGSDLEGFVVDENEKIEGTTVNIGKFMKTHIN